MITPKIIYHDEDILIIDKPAGLVVDDSETQKGETLQSWLAENYPSSLDRRGIAHRLDKDTSGLLLVARTTQALENLQNQFKGRKVKKEYLALVHGEVKGSGKVEGDIIRNPNNREKFTVVDEIKGGIEGGREAVTEYEPVGNFKLQMSNFKSIFNDLNKIQTRKLEKMGYNNFTLLSCYPLTGRTHQIRVHLKYKGFPVVGDKKYAGRKMSRLDHRWCKRQFLHAKKIGFFHPSSGQWLEFERELPEDLSQALNLLTEKGRTGQFGS